jgi:hypothetical protein
MATILMGRLRSGGTGAARQRAVLARTGSGKDVVDWLAGAPGAAPREARRHRRGRGRDVGGVPGAEAEVGRGLPIVVFERGHFTSYSACGIPYWIGGSVKDRDALVAREPAAFRKGGIDVRMRHEVVAIDLDARTVIARDRGRRRHGPRAVRPVGVRGRRRTVTPEWARVDGDGVFGVQTLDDGAAIHAWLDTRSRTPRAVVIGGGYIGIEMAEAMVRRGLESRCWRSSAADCPRGPGHGREGRAGHPRDGHHRRTEARGRGLEVADGRVRAVVTEDGTLPADIVVLGWGYGRTPTSPPTPASPRRDRRTPHGPADARSGTTASGRPATAWKPFIWSAGSPCT